MKSWCEQLLCANGPFEMAMHLLLCEHSACWHACSLPPNCCHVVTTHAPISEVLNSQHTQYDAVASVSLAACLFFVAVMCTLVLHTNNTPLHKRNHAQYDAMASVSPAACLFFVAVICVGNYVMINLFLAILLDNFSSGDEPAGVRGGGVQLFILAALKPQSAMRACGSRGAPGSICTRAPRPAALRAPGHRSGGASISGSDTD